MSKPVLNAAIPNPNNASQGQMGEEQNNSNAGIDSLPSLVLARIFGFAAADQEGFETTAAIRSTSREFRRVNDEVLLPELYYNIKTALRNHPYFQSIPEFQRIINANSDQLKSVQLFKDLSRVIGAPCLLFPEQYLRAHQQLEDDSLVAVWERIARSINFQNEPIPRDPQAIREWINNPDNNQRIQDITELDLSSMNLQVLPQEIGAFVNLQGLDLQDNCLASLPESFGNLRNLDNLDLQNNLLASLPDTFGNLQQLRELILENNQLTSLPESFGNLHQLEWLYLERNQLASLPNSFGNLRQLLYLYLENNQLASLPESLGNLGQLRELNLQNNQIASLPESFGKLGLLKQLRLENNQLASLPESFGNLKQLEQLYLQNNKLASLPDTFGNLQQLVSLDLQNNQLASLSESFGNLAQLRTLHLSNNDLESLPVAIGDLQQLSSFYILNNRLKSLPETFGKLQLLGTLALANNRLKDLPKSFGNLRSMRILDLSNNRLQGLPETFRNLQHQLEWLSFNGNLCLFMLDNKFSAFTSGMTKRILEKYGSCQEYAPRTPLAKLCQLIHNQLDKNLLEPTLLSLPPAMQTKIRTKMEDIWAALPEHQQVEYNELPKADGGNPVFHERDEILNQAIIEVLKETFSTLTQEQKRLVYDQVWDLAGRPESDHQFWDLTGKLQKDNKWGERHAEDNIIRLIDAMALVCEEGISSSF